MKRVLLYVDSNVFLYPVIYEVDAVAEARRSKDFLLKIAKGDVEACTATVTWDEVVWAIRKIFGLEPSLEQGKKLLGFPNLKLLGVRKGVVLMAQELMEEYSLKPRDALHAAAALQNGITTIVSYDGDFDKVKEIRRTEP